MEWYLIVIFIVFVILQSLADRSKGMKKGAKPKPKPPVTAPKTKPKQLFQQKLDTPKKEFLTEKQAARQPLKPMLLPKVSMPVEPTAPVDNKSIDKKTAIPKKEQPQSEAVAAFAGILPLKHEDLGRAVLWSEVLAKPKALRGRQVRP